MMLRKEEAELYREKDAWVGRGHSGTLGLGRRPAECGGMWEQRAPGRGHTGVQECSKIGLWGRSHSSEEPLGGAIGFERVNVMVCVVSQDRS